MVVRGVKGILTAKVKKQQKSYIAEDQSIQQKEIFCIQTTGSNLEEILDLEWVDPRFTQTDSVMEIMDLFGIEVAREKILTEMQKTMNDISLLQTSIYADEMTWSGTITNIRSSGLRKREMNNVCLRLSFQSPNQVIEHAAINTLSNKINGISAPLICGSTPKVGSKYNQISMNESFLEDIHRSHEQDIMDVL